MFFKRANQDKKEKAQEAQPAAEPKPEAKAVKPLSAAELRRSVDPATLGFKTTADLEPHTGLLGQERAIKAIEFGANIRSQGFNLFVLGPPASGKSTAVKSYLQKKATEGETPPDWVYVNNFDSPHRPKALKLPPGRASELSKGMIGVIDELRNTLPAAIEGEAYEARRRAIDEEFRSTQEEALEALSQKANAQNIAVLRTPMGFAMAPMHEGKVVKPEVFSNLPRALQTEVESKIEALQKELEQILRQAPKSEKARRERLKALTEEVASVAVHAALDDLQAAFADLPDVIAYLKTVERDLILNAGLFLGLREEESQAVRAPVSTTQDPRFRRYMVNIVVGNDGRTAGAPIYEELNPSYGNIAGRLEHVVQMGALLTDFLLIKPGALHRANGGYLLIDAREVLRSPFAWEALKRAIRAREIRIEPPPETLGIISTQTLDPEPIPLDVKVVLFGERQLYYLLSALDPDFARLFKVQADFDDTIGRSAENQKAYARLIASIVANNQLKPVDAAGVARVIEEGARLASDSEKLSIEIGRIADIVREADYWAGEAKRKVITREDVDRAIHAHMERSDRVRDRTQEVVERGIVLVDTSGEKVGQINGLSVQQLGDFSFGRATRITARVRVGQGRITDIEREVELGGPLHSKGVMILWGFLAGRYAQEVPLALAASLVFEQSYSGVDGDSASAAELFALLSALADAPLRQNLAVTGSVNQRGEVQAIGGVNEKIEGFFDVCKARGLDGNQGVIIPRSNVQHLMLREDVVEAVREGKFAVHAIGTVDEGIELLTGIEAGERGDDGEFPPGSINRRVEDKLRLFAERTRAFVAQKGAAMPNGKAAS